MRRQARDAFLANTGSRTILSGAVHILRRAETDQCVQVARVVDVIIERLRSGGEAGVRSSRQSALVTAAPFLRSCGTMAKQPTVTRQRSSTSARYEPLTARLAPAMASACSDTTVQNKERHVAASGVIRPQFRGCRAPRAFPGHGHHLPSGRTGRNSPIADSGARAMASREHKQCYGHKSNHFVPQASIS